MFSESILTATRQLTDRCLAANVRLVFAESCTGGLIAAAMTALPGSSRVVERGFVVYSNQAKQQLLGVPETLIDQHGAVSQPVALAMAQGALKQSNGLAQLSIAVTGVAGPDGSEAKPVGLVHIAVARPGGSGTLHEKQEFGPLSRDEIRDRTVIAALHLAVRSLDHCSST